MTPTAGDRKWATAIAARLKAARIAAGLSFRDAAEAAGVTLRTIQRSESGESDTGSLTVCRLAETYGVKPEWLFGSDEL